MKYKKLNIENAEIYLVQNKKFNTLKISTLLINDLCFNNFTKEKLLTNYLSRSINQYKDELTLSKKFLEIYDPSIRISDFYSKSHIKAFNLNMLNEKYTEKGMLKKTIEFYFSFIFDPNKKNNSFDKTNLELSKNSLKVYYRSLKEDPSYNALNSAFSLIDEDIAIKYDTNGYEEDLEIINEKNLYDLYLNEIKTSNFKIFVIGDFNEKEVIEIITNSIKNKINKNKCILGDYIHTKKVKNIITKKEEKDLNQSNLIYIYKLLNMTKREISYVSIVFNTILGGSDSKLFKNVREKKSLCYTIYSSMSPSFGYMHIFAGISKENYTKTKNAIKVEVDNMINGNITDQEIKEAKEILNTQLRASNDNQGNLISRVINNILYNDEIDYEENIKKINSVTKEEIINFAKKIDLNVIYFLRGDK